MTYTKGQKVNFQHPKKGEVPATVEKCNADGTYNVSVEFLGTTANVKARMLTQRTEFTFIEVLNDEEGRRLVDSIEYYQGNPNDEDFVNELIKELKEKTGYQYINLR
jgi:hypothetical protein